MTESAFLLIAAFICISSLVMLIAFMFLGNAKEQPASPSSPQAPARKNEPVLKPKSTLEHLGERLIQAGLYKRNSKSLYYATKIIFVVVPIVLWVLASYAGILTLRTAILYGIMTSILGTILPSFWLDAQKKRRQMLLRRSLPDAVDVIVICVEAGMSVPMALSRVASELNTAHSMLAAELTITQREIQMGCTTGEALKRLADRFDVEEVRSLAAVIEQAEKYGASVVTALQVHAESLREKRFQRAEERAQQAAVKLLVPTVFFIFPALFVVLLGPAMFDIFRVLSDIQRNLATIS